MKSRVGTVTRRSRTLLMIVLALLGALWFIYFDSFSLSRRKAWTQEYEALKAENERLREEIAALEARLMSPPTDEEIERIAREQYGMRREGETVHRVEQ